MLTWSVAFIIDFENINHIILVILLFNQWSYYLLSGYSKHSKIFLAQIPQNSQTHSNNLWGLVLKGIVFITKQSIL